jgi:PhnB protein
MAVKPVPDGYHAVTPYLIVSDGARALDFYRKAFGARERMRLPAPDGRVGHAEIEIGDSAIMLADEFPDMGALGPQTVGSAARR